MRRVDFVISNDRHHVATFAPVLEQLRKQPDVECRVLSLCEFRGLHTPTEIAGIRARCLTPPHLRRLFYGGPPRIGEGGARGWKKKQLAWSLLLEPRLRWIWSRRRPSLVVIPNDYAYPYGHLMKLLHRMHIRSLLVQEGIRFPLPGAADEDRWGTGGATAIAVWGESTAKLLRARGVDPARIHLTGAPRFDAIASTDWKSRVAELALPKASKRLLLVTNPIDHQGFCSTAEKMELVRRFLVGAEALLKSQDVVLLVQVHGGERAQDYRDLIDTLDAERVHLLEDAPLYPLLASVDAAVILASTVGLEALLFGLPLAVIAIPGGDFVHDYVAAGVASGISAVEPEGESLALLLSTTGVARDNPEPYLARHLVTRSQAVRLTSQLIRRMLENVDA